MVNSRPTALITGITGQDGSYLAQLLLEKGYDVHGTIRRVALSSEQRMTRIDLFRDRLTLHPFTIEDFASVFRVVKQVRPDECYHLAAQSLVSLSFQDPLSTLNTNINGTCHVLASLNELAHECKFYFAGSSEMFGKVAETPLTETSRFHPRSPYAISKVAGYDLTRYYREARGMHASSGILFNHESPRRGPEFVTRKVTSGAAQIKLGQMERLTIGNLDAIRDWGHSKEYVMAMWQMLQRRMPSDYVIATGKTHSVRELLDLAFSCVDLKWQDHVSVDESLYRPAEVDLLVGDATKARRELGWESKIAFEQLIEEMVTEDLLWFSN